jgi:hypothetical protein
MPRQATLADTQGTQAADNRPPEEQAGTQEHLGGPRPYEGTQAEQQPPKDTSSGSSSSSSSSSSSKGSSGGSSSK